MNSSFFKVQAKEKGQEHSNPETVMKSPRKCKASLDHSFLMDRKSTTMQKFNPNYNSKNPKYKNKRSISPSIGSKSIVCKLNVEYHKIKIKNIKELENSDSNNSDTKINKIKPSKIKPSRTKSPLKNIHRKSTIINLDLGDTDCEKFYKEYNLQDVDLLKHQAKILIEHYDSLSIMDATDYLETKNIVQQINSHIKFSTDFSFNLEIAEQLQNECEEIKTSLTLNSLYTAFQHLYKKMDSDCSGYLEEDELYRTFIILGYSFNTHKVKDIFQRVDLDGSGQMDFDEFMILFLAARDPNIQPKKDFGLFTPYGYKELDENVRINLQDKTDIILTKLSNVDKLPGDCGFLLQYQYELVWMKEKLQTMLDSLSQFKVFSMTDNMAYKMNLTFGNKIENGGW